MHSWYLIINNSQIGPLSLSDVRESCLTPLCGTTVCLTGFPQPGFLSSQTFSRQSATSFTPTMPDRQPRRLHPATNLPNGNRASSGSQINSKANPVSSGSKGNNGNNPTMRAISMSLTPGKTKSQPASSPYSLAVSVSSTFTLVKSERDSSHSSSHL